MSTLLNIFCIFTVMISVYELICPITQGVVYVGMTKDVRARHFQHIWGSKKDSVNKAKWIKELKRLNLMPSIFVVSEHNTRREAKVKEGRHIAKRIKEGCSLFNVSDRSLYYQYNKDGSLVDVFNTLREIKAKTGIRVHLDRYTSGGFVWTNGEFDTKKLDSLNDGRSVNCKKVGKFTKEGVFIEEFKGVREAYRQTGIDHRSIAQVAGGSTVRKSAGGYKWKYI